MKSNKNIGLIECSSREALSKITAYNNPDGYVVKKIRTNNKVARDGALEEYPDAELVEDISAIIGDSDIELILVSRPKQEDLAIIGEAVCAGKNVRII
ncbi:MAG: hypothetical protein ABI683_06815 [Ginsengibacter sp.]